MTISILQTVLNFCIKMHVEIAQTRADLTYAFNMCRGAPPGQHFIFKGNMSDSFTNYNYVGNTKVSVSIKKTYANKCTLSEIFLTKILKSFCVLKRAR